MGDYKAVCSIPVIEPAPAENRTATELAQAEEAREESRAVASGWELIAELEDTCLYYVLGWWSYSFCRNTEIVQYHALASSPKGQPPKRDLQAPEYVLGRIPTIPPQSRSTESTTENEFDPIPAEIQEKGKQRYLVQRLAGGTICDLTQRERTIEIQYHCVPGLQADKISWIKEVTICAYVMVVDTPRLCNDAAFLPPKPTQANPITCNLVSDEPSRLLDSKKDSREATKQDVKAENGEATGDAPLDAAAAAAIALKELLQGSESGGKVKQAVVGDIKVGSRSILSLGDEAGRTPFKLTPPRSFMTTGLPADVKFQIVVAQGASYEDGGKVEEFSREELRKMDIDPDTVKEMAAQIKKLAGDNGWRLEVSDSGIAGVRELKGYIDEDDDAADEKSKTKTKPKKDTKEKGKKTNKPVDKKKKTTQAKDGEKDAPRRKTAEAEPEAQEQAQAQEDAYDAGGSQEEFYKDEL